MSIPANAWPAISADPSNVATLLIAEDTPVNRLSLRRPTTTSASSSITHPRADIPQKDLGESSALLQTNHSKNPLMLDDEPMMTIEHTASSSRPAIVQSRGVRLFDAKKRPQNTAHSDWINSPTTGIATIQVEISESDSSATKVK